MKPYLISINKYAYLFIISVLIIKKSFAATTYYIDFTNGTDANNGLTKTTPLKRHPYMTGFSGSYSHQVGDKFIFKGGVLWPAGCFEMQITTGGNANNYDYYGVDKTWYTGLAWARPIFDGQGSALDGLFNVGANFIIIDNIELRDALFNSNEGVGLITLYYGVKNIRIKNCFIHKWSLIPSITTDDAHGGIIGNTATVPMTGLIVDSTIISNSEYSNTKNNGVAIRAMQKITNCTIYDMPTAILYSGHVYNNTIYNINYPVADFDPAYHTNLIYMAAQANNPPINYIYNNIIHDVSTGAGIYAEPCFYSTNGPATIYIYNNLVYKCPLGGGGIILVDPEGGNGACGKVFIYNNTLQLPNNVNIGMIRTLQNHSGTNQIDTLVIRNNHYIGSNGEWDTNSALHPSSANNLQQTNTQATNTGYTLPNNYQPTNGGSPTCSNGVSVSCTSCPLFNYDMLGISRPQGSTWDRGAYEFLLTTNINETLKDSKFSFYPNPAKNEIMFSNVSSNTLLEIYDIRGKEVLKTLISDNETIDVSYFSNGLYFLKLKDNKDIIPKKIIINK